MENANSFRQKLAGRVPCLGTCVTFTDPTVTEALAGVLDFLWIDMEHNPLTLEKVQGHIMATRGTAATPLVRVAWNDPVLIKPVLDIGAAGVIVPLVRTADETRRAVAACRYPPLGIRGYGPRRPSRYGAHGGPDYIREADETIIVIVQIEHIDAVNNLDEILAVPGLTSVVVGPNDLSGSMGHMGYPNHPEVVKAIETVVAKGIKAGIPVGLAGGGDPAHWISWARKGVRWLSLGADFVFLLQSTRQLAEAIRNQPWEQ